MSRHAFIDESTRRGTYLICAATISARDLGAARKELRSLRARGQRRLHFASESDQRRRLLLKEMSKLELTSTMFVADDRDQVAARNAIIGAAAGELPSAGVARLVLEAREGQDQRDRSAIYSALGPQPNPAFVYLHRLRRASRSCECPMRSRGLGVAADSGDDVCKISGWCLTSGP